MNFLKDKSVVMTLILTLLVLFVLPTAVEHTMVQRGYFAIGGEWLLLLLPFIILSMSKHATAILNELESEEEEDE